MGAHKLTRWQKASALVPMAVLVGAWGAALTNTGLANAATGVSSPGIPDVPTTAFEQPASVQAGPGADGPGVDAKAGADGTLSTLSTNGIPAASLFAYRQTEALLAKADSTCKLPWNLVAAIGRVESNHGRTNGNTVTASGVSKPGIYGIPLTGANGTARITDTDNGSLDKDAVYDRAVGPMQFLPGTWKSVAVDADGDGKKDPQNINDAAAAAGVYLCAGTGDLSSSSGASAAVLRYNHSSSYVDLVMKISDAYARGDFTQTPDGTGPSAILTSSTLDQTLTPGERNNAMKSQKKANAKSKAKGSKDSGSTSSGATPSTTPSTTPESGTATKPGDGAATPPSSGGTTSTIPRTVGGAIGGTLDSTPLAPVTKPLTGTLSQVEAQLQCTLRFPLGPQSSFTKCVADLTS